MTPKTKAHPKIVAENKGTPPSATNVVSTYFKLVSIAPEPKNKSIGNKKSLFFELFHFFL